MPRRPPKDTLPRGLVWRGFTLNESLLGDPFAEWAYVTPGELDGIRTSALGRAAKDKQVDVARFWFLSNHEPFINDGRWFSFGQEGSGFGQAPFLPSHYPPATLLREEFTGTVPDDALAGLAAELETHAGLWVLIPDPPQTMLTTSDQGAASLQATVKAALANVEAAVAAVASMPASIGHNQGPPLLDPRLRDEIVQAVRQSQEGVVAKEAGVVAVKDGQGRLRRIAAYVGTVLVAAFAKPAGEAIYNATFSAIIQLLHSLNEAATVLGHWLATYPPMPYP